MRLHVAPKIRPDDVLVCYGKYSDFQKLWKAL